MGTLTHSTYQPIGRAGLNQAINATSTTQQHKLGERVTCRDISGQGRPDAEFIYLTGVASTEIGSVVGYTDVGLTALADTDAADTMLGNLAVAMSACVANNYGWYQVQGVAIAAVLSGYADNAKVFLTATAGSIDDAAVKGSYVRGAKGASAVDDAGFAELEICYPQVDAQVVADINVA